MAFPSYTDTMRNAFLSYQIFDFIAIFCPFYPTPQKIVAQKPKTISSKEETTLPGYPHLHLSLSIGAVLQGSADPLEEAVHRADSLMYQAKAKKNAIALEAGPLTLRERNLRRLENFEDEPLLKTAYDIARWHHERWDGRGYPDGLKGNDIPISAQIVSLADVYDALTSERCYKEAFSHETAMRMILNGECGAFNPLLLECLTDIQAELQKKLQKHHCKSLKFHTCKKQ